MLDNSSPIELVSLVIRSYINYPIAVWRRPRLRSIGLAPAASAIPDSNRPDLGDGLFERRRSCFPPTIIPRFETARQLLASPSSIAQSPVDLQTASMKSFAVLSAIAALVGLTGAQLGALPPCAVSSLPLAAVRLPSKDNQTLRMEVSFSCQSPILEGRYSPNQWHTSKTKKKSR